MINSRLNKLTSAKTITPTITILSILITTTTTTIRTIFVILLIIKTDSITVMKDTYIRWRDGAIMLARKD